MKTEVYSWRVSTELKTGLEQEARRRRTSISAVLDLAAKEFLLKTTLESGADQEQQRLHQAASQCLGAFAGGDPRRSGSVRESVRARVLRRHGR